MKRCSASFMIKVMHIKTTMSYFSPYWTDTNPKAGNQPITRGCGDRYLQGFKMVQPWRWAAFITMYKRTAHGPSNPTSGKASHRYTSHIWTDMCATLFTTGCDCKPGKHSTIHQRGLTSINYGTGHTIVYPASVNTRFLYTNVERC